MAAVLAITLGANTAAVGLNTGAASAATVDTSAWYLLANRNSGKAVEVTSRSSADGAAVVQYRDWNASNQRIAPRPHG